MLGLLNEGHKDGFLVSPFSQLPNSEKACLQFAT